MNSSSSTSSSSTTSTTISNSFKQKKISSPYPFPSKIVLDGKYTQLVPINSSHFEVLYKINTCHDAKERYHYLYSMPADNSREMNKIWFDNLCSNSSMVTFVIYSKNNFQEYNKDKNDDEIKKKLLVSEEDEERKSYTPIGHICLMSIEPTHGRIEIGGVKMGPLASRTRCSTESIFLLLDYVFSTLNYRRVEWKCDKNNIASANAAIRFGFEFEGCFRQHIVTRHGQNRDTNYYSILDYEWEEELDINKEEEEEHKIKKSKKILKKKESFLIWLNENNFDIYGKQIKSLSQIRNEI